MKIGLLGAQGSGKTTQAEIVSKRLGLPVVDIGELVRESCKSRSIFNESACRLMDRGMLVPNEYAARILKERLNQADVQDGFVLDGYPRTREQLYLFDPQVDKMIFLNLSYEESVRRLQKRGRVDDTPEGIKNRLKWFNDNISKVLEYYKNEGKLVVIDAGIGMEEVSSEILASVTGNL
ncbi:nucleoside monophosphate kinase [candidate division WWE3 bacterium]|nr:nucleoside monophosphate kinase [candidate division WWE3 bacterium]